MPFTYEARNGSAYHLRTGPKRGGGVQYFVSKKPKPPLADAIPEGFEIYETPNSQVYLRRIKPALILPDEMALVEKNLAKLQTSKHLYLAEAIGPVITIHEAETGIDFIRSMNILMSPQALEDYARRSARFTAVMRFSLIDEAGRIFAPERFCFRGSVDDWIPIGEPGQLAKLITRFFKHLSKESIYDLY
jgi:hypothetical protein